MTLISSHLGGSTGFLTVSDILLTADGDAPVPTAIPLRPHPIFHSYNGRSLAGSAQKCVLLGRTMILWSGPKDVCDKLIMRIAELSEQGETLLTYEDVSRNSGISYEQAHRISFIYHYIVDAEKFTVWAWRCQRRRIGNTDTIFAGSGGPVYADTTDVRAPEGRGEDDLMAILARSIGQLVTEATSNDTLDQYYGGWIELGVRRDFLFAKAKYAIKIWKLRNGRRQYSNGPLIFNFYSGYDLLIGKINFDPEEKQESRELFIISDMLSRYNGISNENIKIEFDPLSLFHIIIDDDDGHVDVLATAGDNLGYDVSVDAEFNYSIKVEPRFWKIITSTKLNDDTWIID